MKTKQVMQISARFIYEDPHLFSRLYKARIICIVSKLRQKVNRNLKIYKIVWFTYDNVLVYHKRKCPECGIIILL